VSLDKKIKLRLKRRALRTRKKIALSGHPRVSVFKSLNHIYAQVIDDNAHKTLASCSTVEFTGANGDKTAAAKAIGVELAKRALSAGVSAAVFDRGSFLYHGRIKALADGLREGGLNI